MPKKHAAGDLVGGPGASHENRQEPEKSRPHGELREFHPEQGNTKRTAQGKSGGDGRQHKGPPHRGTGRRDGR